MRVFHLKHKGKYDMKMRKKKLDLTGIVYCLFLSL